MIVFGNITKRVVCTEEDFRDLSILLFLVSLVFGRCNGLITCDVENFPVVGIAHVCENRLEFAAVGL